MLIHYVRKSRKQIKKSHLPEENDKQMSLLTSVSLWGILYQEIEFSQKCEVFTNMILCIIKSSHIRLSSKINRN